MSEFLSKQCIPCSVGDIPLSEEEVKEYVSDLGQGWELNDKGRITKTYTFKDFKEALDFVNKIGEVAEQEGHHPSIHLSWGKVVVFFWTNKIKGLHMNDFIMAAKVDDLLK